MKSAKVVLAISVAVVGALTAIGCVLAAIFERDGFGRPRDTEPRTWYVALMALGLFASIALPMALAAWALPGWRRTAPYVMAVPLIGAVALFGLTR